jgi:type IV pilus assembly protein PilV
MTRMRSPCAASQTGFTLVEVLVAVLLSAIGLLGLVSMQTMALASTHMSSMRSLVALQASSLTAVMHNNPGYWAVGTSPSSIQLQGNTIQDNLGNQLALVSSSCNFSVAPASNACLPAQLAAFDIQTWAQHMSALLPSYSASLGCSTDPNQPLSCQLTVNWTERYVSIGRSTSQDSAATGGQRSYTLYIQP